MVPLLLTLPPLYAQDVGMDVSHLRRLDRRTGPGGHQKLGLAGGALGLAFASWFGFKSAAGEHTELALQGVRIGVGRDAAAAAMS